MAAKRKQLSPGMVATRRAKPLLDELRGLILAAREQVARTVDSGLTALHWHVGRRIHQDILHADRAAYGQEIVSALGRQLEAEFGRGFSEKSLRHMMRFAEAFPDEKIVSALRRELNWSHFKRLIARNVTWAAFGPDRSRIN